MAALPLPVRLLCLVAAALAAPTPGRIPKVYNALITSNQNLEPSKAYPVYQPVLHDAFAFPYQPAVFYGDYPLTNGLLPAAPLPPKVPSTPQPPASQPEEDKSTSTPSTPPSSSANPEEASSPADEASTPAPPPPPNTESPIPLNQFGLPPQVIPLGRIDPAYNGFTQIGPFSYTYPNFRFYDPFDPYSFNPYANLSPLYRPLPNVLEHSIPVLSAGKAPAPAVPMPSGGQPAQIPPSEPSDLNLLNYSSKDPAIPNVPPPPLPDGGLKPDNAE